MVNILLRQDKAQQMILTQYITDSMNCCHIAQMGSTTTKNCQRVVFRTNTQQIHIRQDALLKNQLVVYHNRNTGPVPPRGRFGKNEEMRHFRHYFK